MKENKRIVMISGVGAGIGQLAAVHFLEKGDIVLGVDIVDETELLDNFRKNDDFAYYKTDITSEEKVKIMFQDVESRFGRLDVLLNIAGGWNTKDEIVDLEYSRWLSLMDLNINSVFLMSRSAVAIMKKCGGGRIVNTSSIAGRMPVGRSSVAYATSKAAIVGFTKYLALESGGYGITVNAVSPGTTLTERTKAARTEPEIAGLRAKVPLGRLAEPIDSVNAFYFLTSEEASFINGHTLDVTGGLYMN